MNKFGLAVATAIALLLASCGTQTLVKKGEVSTENAEIQRLSNEIESTRDPETIAKLMMQRGHIHLEKAEELLLEAKQKNEVNKGFESYGSRFLAASADFEYITKNYPETSSAADAMFHLGYIYDINNLGQLSLAVKYYNETIEKYPESSAAKEAMKILSKYESIHKSLKGTAHDVN